MAPLRVVATNLAAHAHLFDEVRASVPAIEIRHAEHRVSWEDISARRRGLPPPQIDQVSDDLRAALAEADVVVGFYVPRGLTQLAPRLRWIETPSTGIDHLRGTGVLEAAVEVTTVGGLFASDLAEHVFAGMLYFAKRLGHFDEQRRRRLWRMDRVGALHGRTVGLVGVGNIGRAVAARAAAFGMRVIGIGRDPWPGRVVPGVDRVLGRAQLRELLADADYVVLAVADTPATCGMIGAGELAAMRRDAVLINVARGTVVDETALVDALRNGRIGAAALDVFAAEPLPPESPLWALPNVLVTPHVAVLVADYLDRALGHFATNLRRFAAGEPLLDRFDRVRGY
jgi:phosphoglycerate dehydrogenase-like enzyme